jgi:hypothetical protein
VLVGLCLAAGLVACAAPRQTAAPAKAQPVSGGYAPTKAISLDIKVADDNPHSFGPLDVTIFAFSIFEPGFEAKGESLPDHIAFADVNVELPPGIALLKGDKQWKADVKAKQAAAQTIQLKVEPFEGETSISITAKWRPTDGPNLRRTIALRLLNKESFEVVLDPELILRNHRA